MVLLNVVRFTSRWNYIKNLDILYIFRFYTMVEKLNTHTQTLDVRGPTIPKISPQMFRTKIVHTSGILFDFFLGGGRLFRLLESKNIFNLCSHIELNTQNPNPIVKITIPFTKLPNMQKYCRTF